MAAFSIASQPEFCRWLNAISCIEAHMHCISAHRPAGQWPRETAAGTLTLDFDARHRRRIRMTTDQGERVLLNLQKAVAMVDGDGLLCDDGNWLAVRAALEPIVEVRHRAPEQLVRLAWHLGNRHLPTEILDQCLRIRPDHVIEQMLHGFGADLAQVLAPFQPEGGAYSTEGRPHSHG